MAIKIKGILLKIIKTSLYIYNILYFNKLLLQYIEYIECVLYNHSVRTFFERDFLCSYKLNK